jgi:hypothetical protein
MHLNGPIRSRGFGPSGSFVGSAFLDLARRGAHPGLEPRSMIRSIPSAAVLRAWAIGPELSRARALESGARRSTPRLSTFPPARLCGRFYCAEELLIIRYRRDYPFAIRLLLGHSNTVEFITREKSPYQKTLILPIQCRTKNPEFHSENSAPSCTNIWSTFFG